MDYRKTYNEFRNGMIKAIINNADTINSKLTTRKLGYIMCGEPDENIDMGNGKFALRAFIDPIFIVRIEGDAENKQTVPQIFDDRYTEEDLTINFSSNSDSNSDSDMWDTSAILNDDDDDDSWLNELQNKVGVK